VLICSCALVSSVWRGCWLRRGVGVSKGVSARARPNPQPPTHAYTDTLAHNKYYTLCKAHTCMNAGARILQTCAASRKHIKQPPGTARKPTRQVMSLHRIYLIRCQPAALCVPLGFAWFVALAGKHYRDWRAALLCFAPVAVCDALGSGRRPVVCDAVGGLLAASHQTLIGSFKRICRQRAVA